MAYRDPEQGRAKNLEIYQRNKDEINRKRRLKREEERKREKTGEPRDLAIEWLRKSLR